MSFFKKKNKEDEEFLRKLEEEEKELDLLVPEEKLNIFKLLKDNSEEERELREYFSEEEIKEIERKEKEDKKLMIIAGSILGCIFLAIVIGLSVFNYVTQDTMYKDTVPKLEKYYKEKYNSRLKYNNIEKLCMSPEECSDITLLTTKDNKSIISFKDELIGDNISNASVYKEYNQTLKNTFPDLDLISNKPLLSYQDFYLNYNTAFDYIDVLPDNLNYQELLNTKKLTVRDVIIYQGNINLNNIKSYLKPFTSDSLLYFIKHEKGFPTLLTIVSKNYLYNLAIPNSTEIKPGIITYELDRNINAVSTVTVDFINKSDIETLGDYMIDNTLSINYEEDRQGREDEYPTYYLLKVDKTYLGSGKIYQFNNKSGYKSKYDELELSKYNDIATIKVGDSIYIIGNEPVGLGYKYIEKSFWCKLKLC